MIVKILKGFVLGLLANGLGTYIYVSIFIEYKFEKAIELAYVEGYLGSLIGLGAILNLLLFFFFLTGRLGKFVKKVQPYEARGVLMATLLAALAVLYFEF
ncbi:hypothetical protein [Nonlabens xiamenensis]|uniref:hypothetical protein n=1 Tax=Nonlabens xiamenensis TaxID=2341043 RepID=UPI001F0CA0FE|nr:hypothetical protein [Nonlabens xiamenensis]